MVEVTSCLSTICCRRTVPTSRGWLGGYSLDDKRLRLDGDGQPCGHGLDLAADLREAAPSAISVATFV